MNYKILIVDDEQSMCELLEADLKLRDFEPLWFTSADEGFHAVEREPIDIVLTDLKMPGTDGIEFCERIVANRPDIPVIVMTAFGSLETAVAAIRAGAYDFVTKPIELDLLALTLQRAARHRELQEQIRQLSDVVEQSARCGELIGASPVMQKLFDELGKVAAAEASVLITGESGTGKELIARSIHERSPRKDAPFVAVNCAAFTDTLLESELFGHVKGAFTDARNRSQGIVPRGEWWHTFLGRNRRNANDHAAQDSQGSGRIQAAAGGWR